jgi:hypothetical protein
MHCHLCPSESHSPWALRVLLQLLAKLHQAYNSYFSQRTSRHYHSLLQTVSVYEVSVLTQIDPYQELFTERIFSEILISDSVK